MQSGLSYFCNWISNIYFKLLHFKPNSQICVIQTLYLIKLLFSAPQSSSLNNTRSLQSVSESLMLPQPSPIARNSLRLGLRLRDEMEKFQLRTGVAPFRRHSNLDDNSSELRDRNEQQTEKLRRISCT